VGVQANTSSDYNTAIHEKELSVADNADVIASAVLSIVGIRCVDLVMVAGLQLALLAVCRDLESLR